MRRTHPLPAIAVLLLLVFARSLASAQTGGLADPNAALVEKARADFAVPDSPAFAVLNVTPSEVIRPESAKTFAAALLNGIDAGGNLQTGLALDWSPYLALHGDKIHLYDYRDYFVRLGARTQVSLATTKASDDDEAIRLGLGFRVTLWDEEDPRLDPELRSCLGTNLHAFQVDPEAIRIARQIEDIDINGVPGRSAEQATEVRAQLNKELDARSDVIVKRCKDAAAAHSWNGSGFTVGVAPTWISESGRAQDLRGNTVSVWGALAYGFEPFPSLRDTSQLLLTARHNQNELVPDPAAPSSGDFIHQDTTTLAGQLRVAVYQPDASKTPLVILGAEGDCVWADRRDQRNGFTYRVSANGEIKLPIENTYLRVSAGAAGGDDDNADQGFVDASLKFGF